MKTTPISKENISNLFSLTDYLLLKDINIIKRAIWIYFFLLVFEGALRKWFLPFLATPLLIVRDPLVVWIMIKTYKHNLFPFNKYISTVFYITLLSILATFLFGHGNLLVTLFGANIFLLHFPMMFIIGKLFNRNDVIKLGKISLAISIPMVMLIGLQFYSPQSAWVNRGIGNDMAGSGFGGAGDYLRPSGTFSFTTGNVLFFQLVAAFVMYFAMDSKSINRILLLCSSFAFLMAIPLSISRTLFFNAVIVIGFTILAVLSKRKYIGKIFTIACIASVVIFILAQSSTFSVSLSTFADRFETANEQEGGVEGVFIDRFLGGLIGAVDYAFKKETIFGNGLGMGTNVGAKLLTGDVAFFLISEGEWGRLIGELGPILGLAIIFLRLHFILRAFYYSYNNLKDSYFLPWMLFSVSFLTIAQGQWAQPTGLGFSTLFGGLLIASFNVNDNHLYKSIFRKD